MALDKIRSFISLGWHKSSYNGLLKRIDRNLLNNYFDDNLFLSLGIVLKDYNNKYEYTISAPLTGENFFNKNGETSQKVLFKSKNEQNKTIVGIVCVYNTTLNAIEFYDAFFYLQIDLSEIYMEISKGYSFIPCCLEKIFGNYKEPEIDFEKEEHCTIFNIDPFTHEIVSGCSKQFDINSYEFNQIIIKNSELYNYIKGDRKPTDLIDLITNYTYDNGEFFFIDKNNSNIKNITEKANFKKKFFFLRNLEMENCEEYLLKKLLLETDIQKVQNEYQNNLTQIQNLRNEISNILEEYRILEENIDKQKQKEYIDNHTFKYNTSVCLLIKDENDYLEEWLEHYDSIGFNHFYIFDNNSNKPIEETVKEIAGGRYLPKCTIIKFNKYKKNMQFECYQKCLIDYGSESRWIAFLDTDEFLDIDGNNINKFLESRENKCAIFFPWENHGASGRIERPVGLSQKEAFPEVEKDPIEMYGKIILQPHMIARMFVHTAQPLSTYDFIYFCDNTPMISNYKNYFREYKQNHSHLFSYGKIRHYYTRSFEEWCNKILRGTCDPNFQRKFNSFFEKNPDLSYLKEENYVKKLLKTKQGYK